MFLPKPLHQKGMPPTPSKSTGLSKEVGGVLANFITNLVPGPRARLAPGRVPVLFSITEMIRQRLFRKRGFVGPQFKRLKVQDQVASCLWPLMRVPMVGPHTTQQKRERG